MAGMCRRSGLAVALCAIGLLLCGGAAGAQGAQPMGAPERRLALVIGNGAYAASPLKNPPNDAEDIAAALRELGFKVTLLKDADLGAMMKAVRDFGADLKGGGIGLFYYAGHGVQVKGRNFLVPVRSDIQEADEIAYKAVDAQMVLDKMESAGNSTNIVILDACRNNPFPGSERSADRGLAVIGSQPSGSLVVFATAPGQTAKDGNGRNGLFTKCLLDNIRTPGIDVELMIRKVRDAVRDESDGSQVPWSNSSLGSAGFAFAPKKAAAGGALAGAATAPTVPPPLPPRLTVSRVYGSLAISATTAGALFLDGISMGDIPAGAEAKLDSVEVGDRNLEMRYADGGSEKKSVTVAKDTATTVSFSYGAAPAAPRDAAAAAQAVKELRARTARGAAAQTPAPQAPTSASVEPLPEVAASAASIVNEGSVGIQISKYKDFFFVVRVLPGSPAKKAGIREGEFLASVDGKKAAALTLEDFSAKVRGSPGTTVELGLKKDLKASARTIKVQRATMAKSSFDIKSGSGPAVSASVTGLNFYESGYDQPQKSDRSYATVFQGSDVRYLNWEINFDYVEPPSSSVEFDLTARWYLPDGSTVPQSFKAKIEAGWTNSYHNIGWGNAKYGVAFKPGVYRIEIGCNGNLVATGAFIVE